MDEIKLTQYQQEKLDHWQGRCTPTTIESIKSEIDFYQALRSRDAQRVKQIRKHHKKAILGGRERLACEYAKMKREVACWDREIAFLKWLLKQPRNE